MDVGMLVAQLSIPREFIAFEGGCLRVEVGPEE
jgi:hypothetical protein